MGLIYNSIVCCSIWNYLCSQCRYENCNSARLPAALHYYNFHTCITCTINSKYYSQPYNYIYLYLTHWNYYAMLLFTGLDGACVYANGKECNPLISDCIIADGVRSRYAAKSPMVQAYVLQFKLWKCPSVSFSLVL